MWGFRPAVCASFLLFATYGISWADVVSLTGPVPDVSSVAFTPGMHLSNNFNTAIFSGYTIGSIQVDNNDPDGFTLTVSSANGGKFIRYESGVAVVSPVAGDQADYTVTFTDGTGTLGTAAGFRTGPVNFLGVAHTLPVIGSAYVFSFSTATQATLAKKFGLTLTVNGGQASQHLFNSAAGTDIYQDTITITIANQ